MPSARRTAADSASFNFGNDCLGRCDGMTMVESTVFGGLDRAPFSANHPALAVPGSRPEAQLNPSFAHPVIPPIITLTRLPSWASRSAALSAPLQCGPAQ